MINQSFLFTVLTAISGSIGLKTMFDGLAQGIVLSTILAYEDLVGPSLQFSCQPPPGFEFPAVLDISKMNNFEFPWLASMV